MSYCFIWEAFMSKTRASCFIMVFKQRELRWKHSPASVSANIRESKTVWDPEFHTVDSRLRVLDSSLCQWNFDYGLQSLVGFRVSWIVFRVPKSMIPDSTSKFPRFRILGIGFQYLSVHLWFWIATFIGIPDSLSCIMDSKAQDSGLYKQKFLGFRNPDSLTWVDLFLGVWNPWWSTRPRVWCSTLKLRL